MTNKEINDLQEYIHNLIQNRKNIGQEPTGDDLFAVLGHLEILKESQQSLPFNVDKAAKEYASIQLGNEYDEYFSVDINILEAFKAGAEWLAEQGETLYDIINVDGKNQRWLGENLLQGDYDVGQAVIIQIRKV